MVEEGKIVSALALDSVRRGVGGLMTIASKREPAA